MQLPNEKENEINIRNIILSQNCHNVHGEYLPFNVFPEMRKKYTFFQKCVKNKRSFFVNVLLFFNFSKCLFIFNCFNYDT